MPIAREAWLEALKAVEGESDPDALTNLELQTLLGLTDKPMRRYLAALQAKGKIEQTYKFVTDKSGRRQRVLAYKLL